MAVLPELMQHLWLFVLFFLAAVPLTYVATLVVPWGDMKIMHTWNSIPVNWETLGHPSAGSTIDLHVVLEPERDAALTDALSEISNPNHPRYRGFLSKEQVNELVRPSPDTVELACAWLEHNGVPSSYISRTHGGTWLTVANLHVTQASELLGASYQLYRNMKTNETIIRTVGYSLPEVLHRHVQTVLPTTHFSSMEMTVQTTRRRTLGPAPAEAEAASGKPGTVQYRQLQPGPIIVEPAHLRWIYGTIEYQPIGYHPGQNSLAVAGIRLPREQDLAEFMDEYRTIGGEVETYVVGGPVPGNPVVDQNEIPDEASTVAVQYAMAMAFPTPLTFYRIRERQPPGQANDPFLGFALFLTMELVLPQTLIISSNYFLENTIPPGYANLVCSYFGQLGMRGVSVLVASGNNGVGPEVCHQFEVGFPSSCPWVTAVGGTQRINPERATPSSGGGFSRIFDRPQYQERAVEDFLFDFRQEFGNQYAGRYFAFGRAYPDISAQAFGCRIFLDNANVVAAGTSCAVATAGGIVSLLNDFMFSRISEPGWVGNHPVWPPNTGLGFLNPLLYAHPEAFNDIVGGSNPGCNTTGFPAMSGWDPVTGLGTPIFPKLLNILRERRFGPSIPVPIY